MADTDDQPDREVCGSTNTNTGDPCQNPAGSCPIDSHEPHENADEDATRSGRPRKLEDPDLDIQERVAGHIENGESIRAACRLSGISHTAHYEWMDRGRDQDAGVFADYADRIARALGHGESMMREETWETAVEQGDTRTMFKMLASQHPESWGDTGEADEADTSGWLDELRAAQEANAETEAEAEAAGTDTA